MGLACLLSDLAAERDRNCSHQTLTTLLSRKRQEVGEVDLLEENKKCASCREEVALGEEGEG